MYGTVRLSRSEMLPCGVLVSPLLDSAQHLLSVQCLSDLSLTLTVTLSLGPPPLKDRLHSLSSLSLSPNP